MSTHVVIKSGNSKIGPMSATYRTQDTCPTSCPLMKNGCYAEGRIFAIPKKFGSDDLSTAADKLIEEAPHGGIVRWEVSGDVGPDDPWIDESNRVADSRPDLRHIRYTHNWRVLEPEQFAYTVNASCETEEEVAEAVEAGWQAVITMEEGSERLDGEHWIGEQRIVQCPNQTHKVTCKECRLCGKERNVVIAFEAHGVGKRKVKLAVEGKREAA